MLHRGKPGFSESAVQRGEALSRNNLLQMHQYASRHFVEIMSWNIQTVHLATQEDHTWFPSKTRRIAMEENNYITR
jgi:hypothetical protein